MKAFEIHKADCNYNLSPCCVVTANNAKQALKSYGKSLFSSGEKTVIYNDFRHEYELMTSYGACFVATERK